MTVSYRIEIDSLGEVKVPADRLYGAQTVRSLINFSIGDDLIPKELILAFAIVKKAAAIVNHDLGMLDKKVMQLIVQACDEIIAGKFAAEFPLVVWQSGSGTQTNMNVNEVIANRAIQIAGGVLGTKNPVHPNDHVNMAQSSNDCFPTAMHISSALQIKRELLPALAQLRCALMQKEREFRGVLKIGRTHLQDATPLFLSQEISGYVALLDRNAGRLNMVLAGLYEIALGGTAVGTGLNSHPEFAQRVAVKIAELTESPFKSHPNKFAALSAHDELVFASGALRTTACALMKIANDIRWLSSGPRCGLQELILPANEPGSSMMPGKVNPTQCEALLMIANQVMSNDVAIGFAGTQGNFELNTFKPALIFNFLNSVSLLKDAVLSFVKHCVVGLKANEEKLKQNVRDALMSVTALCPIIGYDKAAKIAQTALADNITLREACLKLEYLSATDFDKLMLPKNLTHAGFGKS